MIKRTGLTLIVLAQFFLFTQVFVLYFNLSSILALAKINSSLEDIAIKESKSSSALLLKESKISVNINSVFGNTG